MYKNHRVDSKCGNHRCTFNSFEVRVDGQVMGTYFPIPNDYRYKFTSNDGKIKIIAFSKRNMASEVLKALGYECYY